QPRSFLGCYSFTNHVLSRLEDNGTSVDVPTLTDALSAEFPAAQITTVAGTDFLDPDPSGIAEAAAAAQDAELAVLAVGDLAGLFGAGTPGDGCDVESLQLPGAQHDLVEAVLATGTPRGRLLVTGPPSSPGASPACGSAPPPPGRAATWGASSCPAPSTGSSWRCSPPAPPWCCCSSPAGPARWGPTAAAPGPSCRPSCPARRARARSPACSPAGSTPPAACPSGSRTAWAASPAPTSPPCWAG